jgi:trk system potassium uptake protein TrkH
VLFWRSFTPWLGGMGVLVFLMAVIQMSGGSNMNLMRAESPGPSVGKLVPKAMHTARILYIIYFGLTAILAILLLLGQMPLFDAITTAFGTAGTGGFGIKNDSMASYSPYIQWVVTVFMILFGVNFNAYYLLLFRKWKQAFHMEEVWHYFMVIAAAIVIIMINTWHMATGFWEHLREVAFQVASIITTTGFATTDFDLWPETSKVVLVLLMFVGACAGSTGGGMKVSRFVLMLKTVSRELKSYLYPKSIKKIKVDGKPVESMVLKGINVYFITYVVLFAVSVFFLSFENLGLVTNFTAVAATINNIGPGLELVGPTQNFGMFSNLSKYVLMFDMLAGRLELFPLLILIYPPSWSGLLKRRKKTA